MPSSLRDLEPPWLEDGPMSGAHLERGHGWSLRFANHHDIRRLVEIYKAAMRTLAPENASVVAHDEAWLRSETEIAVRLDEGLRFLVVTPIGLSAASDRSRPIAGFLRVQGNEIDLLYTDPHHDRRGATGALLNLTLDRLRHQGHEVVRVVAGTVLAPVFRRYGFGETGRTTHRKDGVTYELVHLEARLHHSLPTAGRN